LNKSLRRKFAFPGADPNTANELHQDSVLGEIEFRSVDARHYIKETSITGNDLSKENKDRQ
jgi:hypothetical protein